MAATLTTTCANTTAVACIVYGPNNETSLNVDSLGALNVYEPVTQLRDLPPSVTSMYIASNSLATISPNFSSGSTSLAKLSLRFNKLDASLNTVHWPSSLTSLDLTGNRMAVVNASFVVPAKLRTLALNSNAITIVKRWTIPSTLQSLSVPRSLYNNAIVTFDIDSATFAALAQVQVFSDTPIRATNCAGDLKTFLGAVDANVNGGLPLKHTACVYGTLGAPQPSLTCFSRRCGCEPDGWIGLKRPSQCLRSPYGADSLQRSHALESTTSLTGVYVGIAVAVIVVGGAVLWYCRRQRRAAAATDAPYGGTSTPSARSATKGTATVSAFEPLSRLQNDTSFAYAYDIRNDAELAASRIPKRELLDKRVCGCGGFAIVYEAQLQDRAVAVKELQASHTAHIQAFMHEIKTFSTLDHPNVVAFVGVSWTTLHDLALVTEFLPRGDLRDLLASDLGPQQLSWTTPATTIPTTKLQIAVHVVDALTYLHSFEPKLLHRDLKSRNVLLAADWTAKLTDFGISREMADATMTSEAGTTAWMAPEVLTNQGRYNEKADVYSFGVVLSELDTWKVPYADASRTAVQTALLVSTGKLQPDFRSDCPPVIHDLAIQCLAMDPSARPTAAQTAYALRMYLREASPK
ncbi:protein kinase [Achlya hypogyna]|uniref:Protein kinase n=1 Tax=Achlya hypogyna TaxID=1202772 RepID=A0A1V9Z3V7_ACHHY|nr:protein kinase [Achlya hypogyna]